MTTVAIVGSRRRTDKASIMNLVMRLQTCYGYMTIVSGGCRGPDTWAVEAAQKANIPTRVYRPTFPPDAEYYTVVKAYYARNAEIAQACDIMYAFVSPDRTGGTENAIRHATRLGKRVVIL